MNANKLWNARAMRVLYLWARINLFWAYINCLIYIVHIVAALIGWVTYKEEIIWLLTLLYMFASIFGLVLAIEIDKGIKLASKPFSYFMGTSLILFFNATFLYTYWRDILPFG